MKADITIKKFGTAGRLTEIIYNNEKALHAAPHLGKVSVPHTEVIDKQRAAYHIKDIKKLARIAGVSVQEII